MLATDLLTSHFRLTAPQKAALKKLRLNTVHDLLYHVPVRYEAQGEREMVQTALAGAEVTLYGMFVKLETKKSWARRIPVTEGIFEDGSGRIKAMWFHQPYIAKMITLGKPVKVVAKIAGTNDKKYLANPVVEKLDSLPDNIDSLLADHSSDASRHRTLHDTLTNTSLNERGIETSAGETNSLMPVYAESRGITSLWVFHALKRVFESGLLEVIEDPLPAYMREKYHLPELADALLYIHTPRKQSDADAARKRFAFEEVLCVQLIAMQRRREREDMGAIPVELSAETIAEFTSRFPFSLTEAQNKAVEVIVKDMSQTKPMSRLLEGDVGSGKTAVAATVAYAAVMARDARARHLYAQVAYMAPTEVLAKQLFANFCGYFAHLPVRIGLLTGDTILKFPAKSASSANESGATKVSRAQLLKWVAEGEVQILIGTHAVVQKTVVFSNLALAIIDEQHRFGTNQRLKIVQKHKAENAGKDIAAYAGTAPRNISSPHLLSMTATPIPRTLALTIYGDLDLTLLDSMPPGRKPVITEIVKPTSRNEVYEKVRKALEEGRQAYVICPRIDEPDPDKEFAMEAKSVVATVEELRSGPFKHYDIGMMHSKQSAKEKDEVMADFAAHHIHILVATSVVEVGVNVPNATIIMIEGAERFGLAQLHQLRGRVIRSTHQAYCYLISESKSQNTKDRLKAITTAKNGFELAEKDLTLRGSGELYGRKQWGVSDIGMEAIKNLKMVEAARAEAKALVDTDQTLNKYPALKKRSAQRDEVLHFE
jgi:ATP-dependent DNA helicase RecG